MRHTKHFQRAVFAIALALCGWPAAARAQAEISVLAPRSTRESFEKLMPGFEAASGRKIKLTYDTGEATKQRAARGDAFDVFVVLPPYPDALASGNIDAATKTTLGSFVLAVIVKKDAPHPDISTADAVKRTLLAAKSMMTVDPSQGSVGVATNAMFEKLGISEQMKSKTKYVPNPGLIETSIAAGETEIGLGRYVSDLNHPPATIDVVGGLPASVVAPVEIVAFVATRAKDSASAKTLLQYLVSPDSEAVYKSLGILPRP